MTSSYAENSLPPKRPQSGGWLGAGAVLVAMLCLSGVTAIAIRSAMDFEQDAAPARRPPAVDIEQRTFPSIPPSQRPASAGDSVYLVAPAVLGNRQKTPLATHWQAEIRLVRATLRISGLGDLLSGSYASPANDSSLASQRLVMFSAGPLWADFRGKYVPRNLFDAMISANYAVPSNTTDVSPGSLGGQAQCADATIDGARAAVCAWTDQYTVGVVVVFYETTIDVAKAEFIAIREQIERRP